MANTYTQLIAHIVFSTKNRLHTIPSVHKDQAYAYMGGIINNLGGSPIIINGMPDHVHVLTHFPAKRALSDLVRDLKSNSSSWMSGNFPAFDSWQTGLAAFSVDRSGIPVLTRYIQEQEMHHKHKTFREELLKILDEAGIEYDERYLWE